MHLIDLAFFVVGVAVGWLLDTVLEGHRRRMPGRYAGAYTGRCPDCRGKYPKHKWHCRWRPI
ncbi:MAG TPA: hypothetical protein VFA39_18940 [Steroidobacteraceae bacterium]|nr:hypothetical protein [Steroidobacteraceae bacterium]